MHSTRNAYQVTPSLEQHLSISMNPLTTTQYLDERWPFFFNRTLESVSFGQGRALTDGGWVTDRVRRDVPAGHTSADGAHE